MTVKQLSEGFHETFETFVAREDVFAEDVFFDLNMPGWRFQIQGRKVFAEQIAKIARGPVRVDVCRTVATVSGFATEHVEHQQVDGRDLSARRLFLCDVVEGLIGEVVVYCTGEWDDELRARHAAEAPMLR